LNEAVVLSDQFVLYLGRWVKLSEWFKSTEVTVGVK
jgi:hypothetical protein